MLNQIFRITYPRSVMTLLEFAENFAYDAFHERPTNFFSSKMPPKVRGASKPIHEKSLPGIVNGQIFTEKEGSRHERGFTAVCCTCDKELSVPWGINSTLTRHLTSKGHEGIFDQYKAETALEVFKSKETDLKKMQEDLEKHKAEIANLKAENSSLRTGENPLEGITGDDAEEGNFGTQNVSDASISHEEEFNSYFESETVAEETLNKMPSKVRGASKPINERSLPGIVNGHFFTEKEGSRRERGFIAICCTCNKESSVAWGINSSLVRHLTTKGHEGILDEYKALQQENPLR